MSVSGNRFLELSGAETFVVTNHALDRIQEQLGFRPTQGLAHVWFSRSRQLSTNDMHSSGYRPGYRRRRAHGQSSWYFGFRVFGADLVAVVSKSDTEHEYTWITTYARNPQADLLCGTYVHVPAVA